MPSEDNPADMGSRGCTPNELKNNDLWWSGSDWLTEPFSKWPLDIQLDMQQSSVKLEENKEEKSTVSSNYVGQSINKKHKPLFDLSRYSAYKRLD